MNKETYFQRHIETHKRKKYIHTPAQTFSPTHKPTYKLRKENKPTRTQTHTNTRIYIYIYIYIYLYTYMHTYYIYLYTRHRELDSKKNTYIYI